MCKLFSFGTGSDGRVFHSLTEPFCRNCVTTVMSQVTSFGPYRWFDSHWQPRLDLAAKGLREVQDVWLLSESPFPVERTISTILHIFAFDFRATGFIRYRGITPAELQR